MAEILNVDTEPTKPAQTPAPATEPTSWMSADGEIRESAPENIRTLFEKKKWTNTRQVVDGYNELEKLVGAGEHLFIPESEDDTEGWDKVRTQLGWVGSPDKYEFNYEGDVEISQELLGQFKEYANKRRWSQKEFEDTVKFQLDAVTAQTEAYNTQLATQKEENIQALKQKWGEANYAVKVKGAKIIADSLGIYQTLEAKGLASDPDIISMLDTIANRTSEDVITPQPPATPQKSPLEELAEIKKSEAFTKKFHEDHKKTIARFMELNQIIANSGLAPKRMQA